jgi:hypothetical protein
MNGAPCDAMTRVVEGNGAGVSAKGYARLPVRQATLLPRPAPSGGTRLIGKIAPRPLLLMRSGKPPSLMALEMMLDA